MSIENIFLCGKGSFTNHVDKMRWVGGRLNIHECPCKVGGRSLECPHGQNLRQKGNYVGGNIIHKIMNTGNLRETQ